MRRRNVPCSPCSGGSSSGGCCCGLKEKLRILWDRTIGSILKINDITPDGDGNFTIEAGSNIALSETGTGNGIRIDTTGGVSYYTGDGQYIDVDNNDLEISAIVGTGGLAKDSDVQTLATGLTNLLNKLTVVDLSYAPGSSVTVGLGSTLKRYNDNLVMGRFLNTTVAIGTHTFIQGLPRSAHHQRLPLFSESQGWIGTVVISENSTAMTYNATASATDAYVDFEYIILS